eukprot:COSAG06_NODE_741_length_12661_cov_24.506607_7_plen_78_part_00
MGNITTYGGSGFGIGGMGHTVPCDGGGGGGGGGWRGGGGGGGSCHGSGGGGGSGYINTVSKRASKQPTHTHAQQQRR